jgi:hypothetical protein
LEYAVWVIVIDRVCPRRNCSQAQTLQLLLRGFHIHHSIAIKMAKNATNATTT